MGIPRLTQDVIPYAEVAIFGQGFLAHVPAFEVMRLVIDGPSLVYHVFSALLKYRIHCESKHCFKLPSYQEINLCLLHFLDDVGANGTEVQSIIFDGALPVEKRTTRLHRLEKSRQDLDRFHKTRVQGELTSLNVGTTHTNVNAFHSVLWETHVSASDRRNLLPAPPFMVASAIECLRLSRWSKVVFTVPGEADGYCARQAARLEASVLSNDSDLLLYDMGPKTSLVLLRSLELIYSADEDGTFWVRGQSLRPVQIARRLAVPSLLAFAFHRSNDPSLGTGAVSRLAQDSESMSRTNSAWEKFKNDFTMPEYNMTHEGKDDVWWHRLIQNLDPRTAEVMCSFVQAESPHMYLPVTFEDPARDSPWEYSRQLRQLAYSVLAHQTTQEPADLVETNVIEYARRGSRIAHQQVPILSRSALLENLISTSRLVEYYLIDEEDATTTSESSSGSGMSKSDGLPCHTAKASQYYFLAANVVIARKLASSKQYEPAFYRLCAMTDRSMRNLALAAWDEIHLHACILCTLYSFRMLAQSVTIGSQNTSTLNQDSVELSQATRALAHDLHAMPRIANLFLDVPDFRASLSRLDPEYTANNIEKLLRQVDPTKLKRPEPGLGADRERATAAKQPKSVITSRDSAWQQIGKNKGLNRKSSHSISNEALLKVSVNHPNSFALLQTGHESSGASD